MAKKGKIHGFETVNDIQRPSRIKKYQYLYLIVCEDEIQKSGICICSW